MDTTSARGMKSLIQWPFSKAGKTELQRTNNLKGYDLVASIMALAVLVANAPLKSPANPFSLIHADRTVTMAAFLFAMMHQF